LFVSIVGLGLAGLALALLSGCQTYSSSQTLPSGRYLEHPPQYIPPSAPFPLPRELAAQEAAPACKGCAASVPIPSGRTEKPRQQKSVLVKGGDLEDFAVKADGMTFNNFCLAEVPADRHGELPLLKVKGCYRNRTSQQVAFSLVVVGLDEAEEPLWACSIPGNTPGKDVGCLQEVAMSVPPGALKRTASLRFRANVVPSDDPAIRAGSPSTSTSVAPAPTSARR